MATSNDEMMELHWLFDMLHTIDVGLVVLNTHYEVQLWNSFMENHSGISSTHAKNVSLFELFPDLKKDWLTRKLDNVFSLKTPVFISWEQRPYLFPFKSYRPMTGIAERMFQNITLRPLTHVDGSVQNLCMVVYDVTDVATNKAALSAANKKLDIMSRTDALTGMHNRSSLDQALEMVFNSFQTDESSKHSVVMVDVDHFKKVNDEYGHPVGDVVLQNVAKSMTNFSRRGDFTGRFGGEEFAVLLPNTDLKGAAGYAEALRKRVEASVVTGSFGEIKVTVSLGAAQIHHTDKDVKSWLNRADQALYQAKRNGRNQTALARPPAE